MVRSRCKGNCFVHIPSQRCPLILTGGPIEEPVIPGAPLIQKFYFP